MNKTLIDEAIADAKLVQKVALQRAKHLLALAFTPRIKDMLSSKIQAINELEDEDKLKLLDTTNDKLILKDQNIIPLEDDLIDLLSIQRLIDLSMNTRELLDTLEEKKKILDLYDMDSLLLAKGEDEDLDAKELLSTDPLAEEDLSDVTIINPNDEDYDINFDDEVIPSDVPSDLLTYLFEDPAILEPTSTELLTYLLEDENTESTELLTYLLEDEDTGNISTEFDENNLEDKIEPDEDIKHAQRRLAALQYLVKTLRSQNTKLVKENKTYLHAIEYLKNQNAETKLVNIKIGYITKLFESKTLTLKTKMQVILAFDKAESEKEAKLVYESLKVRSSKPSIRNEGVASKPVLSTKPRVLPILKLDNTLALIRKRNMKLAGIKQVITLNKQENK